MGVIGSSRQVFLLCDSWYPKAEVAGLINEFGNLGIICNARVDTAMYELPLLLPGSAAVPGNTGSASTWKILSWRHPKAVTGR